MKEPRLIVNRRLSARTPFRGAARVQLASGVSLDVQMWDLGGDGASLISPRPIPQGSTIDLRFELPAAGASTLVVTRAKAVYSSYTAAAQFRIGLVFLDLSADGTAAIDAFCRPTP